jgi:regulator of replication initiation timing
VIYQPPEYTLDRITKLERELADARAEINGLRKHHKELVAERNMAVKKHIQCAERGNIEDQELLKEAAQLLKDMPVIDPQHSGRRNILLEKMKERIVI